jgi:anti-sigma B factor antagonist
VHSSPDLNEFSLTETVLRGGAVAVAVTGDVDIATAPKLKAVLDRLARQRRRTMLDLSGATFMESAGLAVIVRAARESARDGWPLDLDPEPSAVVLALFAMTGVSAAVGLGVSISPSSAARRARDVAADIRDVAADERDRDAARRALREKALDKINHRDPSGRSAFERRDALMDRQAAATDRHAAAQDRAAERAGAPPQPPVATVSTIKDRLRRRWAGQQ